MKNKNVQRVKYFDKSDYIESRDFSKDFVNLFMMKESENIACKPIYVNFVIHDENIEFKMDSGLPLR